jgi:hypothetical protein
VIAAGSFAADQFRFDCCGQLLQQSMKVCRLLGVEEEVVVSA